MPNKTISLRPDLVRRVRNLALGPTNPSNVLIPIFEAIYNSLHAVQDRFGSDWHAKGRATIALLDFDTTAPSIEIRDNGIGLDRENFESFLTYDSGHKVRRGGKGVGRLSWLKVFERAEIVSRFRKDGTTFERRLALLLDNEEPIRDYSVTEASGSEVGTTVKLRNMKAEYARHLPRKADTIIRKVVAHFLPYLVGDHVPLIIIETDDFVADLLAFVQNAALSAGPGQPS